MHIFLGLWSLLKVACVRNHRSTRPCLAVTSITNAANLQNSTRVGLCVHLTLKNVKCSYKMEIIETYMQRTIPESDLRTISNHFLKSGKQAQHPAIFRYRDKILQNQWYGSKDKESFMILMLLSRNSKWFNFLLVSEVDSCLLGPPSSNLLLPPIWLKHVLPCRLKTADVKSGLMQCKLTAASNPLLVTLYILVSKTFILVSDKNYTS